MNLENRSLSNLKLRTEYHNCPNHYVVGYDHCITGETLVAVADGRNAAPIRELIGTIYPVYTIKNGKTTIRQSVKTCKIKKKAEIWKLTLDDGSILKATPYQLIMLRNGVNKPLKDLVCGESLMPFNSYVSNYRYRQIASNTRRDRRQYRMIAEYYGKIVNPKITAIHHKNFNSFDDCISNLEALPHEEHKKLHSEKMKGENNPVKKMSKKQYRDVYFNFYNNTGDKNPMFGKQQSDITKSVIGEKSKLNWDTQRDFMSERIKNGMTPEVKEKISEARRKWIAQNPTTKKVRIKSDKPGFTGRTHSDESRRKTSESLKGRKFSDEHRKKLSEAAIRRYNHKVVSVEFQGYEDIFNMTVEETNNFGVITSFKDDRFLDSSGIFIHGCTL